MVRNLLFIFFIALGTLAGAQSSTSAYPSQNESLTTEVLKVFPNPTVEYFQLTENSTAKKITVFTMFGKEVKSFNYYHGAQYNVSELKTGMYIVKISDENNKVLKAIKLQKNFSGA